MRLEGRDLGLIRAAEQSRNVIMAAPAMATCNVEVIVHDLVHGHWTVWDRRHNLVTTAGLNLIRDRLSGSGDALSHVAVGTGLAAPTHGDTALGAEVFRDVFTQTTPATGRILYRYFLGPNDANGNTLAEVGLLNAASLGTLYARVVLMSPIVKTISIAVTFGWTLSWSSGLAEEV